MEKRRTLNSKAKDWRDFLGGGEVRNLKKKEKYAVL